MTHRIVRNGALFLQLLLAAACAGSQKPEVQTGRSQGAAPGRQAEARDGAGDGESSPFASKVGGGEPLPERPKLKGGAVRAHQRGVELSARGEVGEARAAFEEALEEDARAYPALVGLGVLSDRAGDETRALEYYRRALSIQPDYEPAVQGIVAIYLRRGAAQDAIRFAEPIARRWVRNLMLQAVYADALVGAARFDEAWAVARGALQRDERFVPAMVVLVRASLRRGQKELAASILEQALAVDAKNADLHFLRGTMIRDEQPQEALEELRRAVRLRPEFVEARVALGSQLLGGGNYDEALREFQAAYALAPMLLPLQLGLAEAYRATKQWQKAKELLDRIVRARERTPEAHFNLALLYMSAGPGLDGMDTLASLQRAVQEFRRYRDLRGPALARDDPSAAYLEDLDRQIEREERRIERERARQQQKTERGPRDAPSGTVAPNSTAGPPSAKPAPEKPATPGKAGKGR